jgi:pyruvate formate lyase activating enzyme
VTGIVFDIQRFSLHDGPGIRTTIFTNGCQLRCAWCQNPEGLTVTTEFGAREMTSDEVVAEALRDRVFYETSGGGVTISGGEPLFQAEFTRTVLAALRDAGIHTAIETCLAPDGELLESFLPVTNLFLVDLKIADADDHVVWTGRDNTGIQANFRRLVERGASIRVRIPLIPGATATADNLRALGRFVAQHAPGVPVELLNFNPLAESKYRRLGREYRFAGVRPFDDTALRRFREFVAAEGAKVAS